MFLNNKTALNFGKHFLILIAYSLYCVFWIFIRAVDLILDTVSFESHHSSTYSAKIGRVLFKQKFCLMVLTSPSDFVCLFRSRVKPEYVLQPNVSLYHLTSKEATFVETHVGVNVFHSDIASFSFLSQFHHATKVIKMSMNDFVSLAEKVGDPTIPVTWMSSTGRCGGTMVCQLFETVPGAIAMHEPDPPSHVYHMKGDKTVKTSDYEAILRSMVRIMCKPCPGVTRILIKPRPMCTYLLDDIYKSCPGVKHIFIYRNSLKCIRSWLATLTHDPYVVVMRSCMDAVWFSSIFPYYRNALRIYFTSKREDEPYMPLEIPSTSMIATAWANQVLYAREKMTLNQIIFSLKYEEIVSRPKESITYMFDRLEIDLKHTDNAVSSLYRDSQRGSPLSRERIGDAALRFMTESDRLNCDAILSKKQLPRMGEDFNM